MATTKATYGKPGDHDYVVKIILIGDSGVGKSSILLRWDENAFYTSFLPTIGIDYRNRVITDEHGKTITVQLWDTGGQERFRTITEAYYRSAHGVVLVYDVTDPQSFDNIRNWIRTLTPHETEGDTKKILIGNKIDLEKRRVITTEMGAALAAEYGIPFFETSAKTAENVNEAIDAIIALAIPLARARRASTVIVPPKPDEPSGQQSTCPC